MIKRLLVIASLSLFLTGCFMAPMALLGPVTSGFSTASIIQSGATSGVNYMVKKSTGKTLSEHALDAISKELLQQAYLPKDKKLKLKKKTDISK